MSLSTCICGGSLRPVDDHLECEACGATAAHEAPTSWTVDVLIGADVLARFPDDDVWIKGGTWASSDDDFAASVAEVYDIPRHLRTPDRAHARMRILDAPTHVFHYAAGLSGDHWLLVHHGRGGRPWTAYAHRDNRRTRLT